MSPPMSATSTALVGSGRCTPVSRLATCGLASCVKAIQVSPRTIPRLKSNEKLVSEPPCGRAYDTTGEGAHEIGMIAVFLRGNLGSFMFLVLIWQLYNLVRGGV